jgi:excisionase family DNA binding protein
MRNTPTNELLDQLLTVGEAAALLRCSPHSLNRWRLTGGGPQFVRVGRRVRYARTALADFIASSTRISTSDRGGRVTATAA